MAKLAQILEDLKTQRSHTAKELQQLDEAIVAVGRLLSSNSLTPANRLRTRRRLSAAARKRIADAQRARWAKLKKQKAA